MTGLSTDIYKRIVSAKVFIDENFNGPINLDTVSGQAYFSRFHFHRLFTRIYRRTPHQYITQKRLDKARLLLTENKSVTAICNEVGFESIGSFSALFKKEIGFTPQYYRNMAFKKKTEWIQQPQKAIPHCFISQYLPDEKTNPRIASHK
ncbi:MAG: helix-turn-helix transcriptional regulator [Bacteroidetes bacterium]|nr:helix-turn-helix transcriptional regulator [Bacteroidota bacterium]